jgi:hypothetical protein
LKRKYENFRFHIFSSIHTLISLNQGQGSIFKLRKVRAIDFSPRGFWAREIDWRKSHVQKNFPDPLVVKTCNVFSKKCDMFSPLGVRKIIFERGTCANRFLVPENPMYWTSGIKRYKNRTHSVHFQWTDHREEHFFSIFVWAIQMNINNYWKMK